MGNRGALTGVKKAHPSEFWMRMGFGWGRMGILQAVTMVGPVGAHQENLEPINSGSPAVRRFCQRPW